MGFEQVNAEILDSLVNQSKESRLEWLKSNFPDAMRFISMVNEMEARSREGSNAQLDNS